jgi:hypothetical protein
MCFQKRLINDYYRPATNRKSNQESKRIGGRVRVCGSARDIRQCLNAGILAPVLHIEGAEA